MELKIDLFTDIWMTQKYFRSIVIARNSLNWAGLNNKKYIYQNEVKIFSSIINDARSIYTVYIWYTLNAYPARKKIIHFYFSFFPHIPAMRMHKTYSVKGNMTSICCEHKFSFRIKNHKLEIKLSFFNLNNLLYFLKYMECNF